MNISQAIEELEQLLVAYGDVPLCYQDNAMPEPYEINALTPKRFDGKEVADIFGAEFIEATIIFEMEKE